MVELGLVQTPDGNQGGAVGPVLSGVEGFEMLLYISE